MISDTDLEVMVAEVREWNELHLLVPRHPRMETAPRPEDEQPECSESLPRQQAGPIIAWKYKVRNLVSVLSVSMC